MLIDILFEDSDLLVVNKPSGLPVLPDGWNKDAPYLIKLLQTEFGRLWVVHRLDKVTSGVFLLARSAVAHRAINIQFEHHQVAKKYHAILVGVPAWIQKHATQPLKQNSGHSHRTVVDWTNGKQASTQFQVTQFSQEYIFVEAFPKTGRTHQIRAHASALGHPILADNLYGAPLTDIISRPALHACNLQFTHPINGLRLDLTAPYPDDFQAALLKIKFKILSPNTDPDNQP
jgi:RluA family pseudouridine synthase